jgi:hypothetical protein
VNRSIGLGSSPVGIDLDQVALRRPPGQEPPRAVVDGDEIVARRSGQPDAAR